MASRATTPRLHLEARRDWSLTLRPVRRDWSLTLSNKRQAHGLSSQLELEIRASESLAAMRARFKLIDSEGVPVIQALTTRRPGPVVATFKLIVSLPVGPGTGGTLTHHPPHRDHP
jgi:hypothetical protein